MRFYNITYREHDLLGSHFSSVQRSKEEIKVSVRGWLYRYQRQEIVWTSSRVTSESVIRKRGLRLLPTHSSSFSALCPLSPTVATSATTSPSGVTTIVPLDIVGFLGVVDTMAP